MAKILTLARAVFRKEFWAKFWGTFLGILALPSALLTITGAHWSIEGTAVLLSLALLCSILIHRKVLGKKHIPSQAGIFVSEKSYLRCPCDLKLADKAKKLAEESYSAATSIPPERFEQLRVKNPLILACLVNATGDLMGYFDIIPLKKEFAEMLLRGSVTEVQITHEDILPPKDMGSCAYLFLSGLAVKDPESHSGRIAASILVWGMMKYIEKFYGSSRSLAFAIASTSAGADLLRKFKFAVGCAPSQRIDKHTLYQLPLSDEALAQRLACVPDWGTLCSPDWLSSHESESQSPPQRAGLPANKAYNLSGVIDQRPSQG